MISRRDFDVDGYQDDISRSGFNSRVLDIDTALALANSNDRFTEEFLQEATEKAKKELLRKLHRTGFIDQDGVRVKWMNIEEADEETGEIKKGYKQLDFFTIDNFEYAIRECKRRVQSDHRKLVALCRLAGARCGNEAIQQRFPWKLPFGKKADAA